MLSGKSYGKSCGNHYYPMVITMVIIIILVGGLKTILKNMSSSMGRMTSHMKWKIKFMFQTTNQLYIYIVPLRSITI